MRGVLEKSDLLRVAKAHRQLWECRRICLCDKLSEQTTTDLRLYSAMCVFRIATGSGLDLCGVVKGVADGLKRTRQRLALLVHPDKAINELSGYKAVFEEAFKALINAHETLSTVVAGTYSGTNRAPQQQPQQHHQTQQQQWFGFTPAAGFPGGFTWSYPGFPGFPGSASFFYTA
jgi:hypothetical protein